MIIDIIQNIADACHLNNQICISQMNRSIYDNIFIRKLNISMSVINQQIIEQHKFSRLVFLKCDSSPNIYDVNHLANSLQELYCSGTCGINQNGITELKKIRILDCSKNKKIIDVNHLNVTLKELYCGYGSGVQQIGISLLKELEYLNCSFNKNIISVSHLKLEHAHTQFSGIQLKN